MVSVTACAANRRSGFPRRRNRIFNQYLACVQGSGRVLDRNNFRFRRQGLKSIPDGILSFRATGDNAKWLLKIKFSRQFREPWLQAIA